MRGLTFQGPRKVRLEPLPFPEVTHPGDVIVEVTHTAICGSDLHVYRGDETGLDPGTILGHEFVGRVVETGSEVQSFRSGDIVVSPFSTCCGQCPLCREGIPSRCDHGQLFGWVEKGRGLQGAQAGCVRVPMADTTLVAVPEDLAHEEALLAGDVLSTGCFGAEMAGAAPGRTIAVLGCGPVGLASIIGARERGAHQVLALDSIDERLALAERFGATPIQVADAPKRQVLDRTDGRGAHSVIEAVGTASASRAAVEIVRTGGTLASVGVHNEANFGFAPGALYDKNLTYRTGRCPARRYIEELFGILRSKTYPLGELISHRMPLHDGVRAYEMFDQKIDGCTKVVLQP